MGHRHAAEKFGWKQFQLQPKNLWITLSNIQLLLYTVFRHVATIPLFLCQHCKTITPLATQVQTCSDNDTDIEKDNKKDQDNKDDNNGADDSKVYPSTHA